MYLLDFLRLTVTAPGALSAVWLVFQIWLQCGADGCKFRNLPSVRKTVYSQSGTVNIGIIMSVHAFQPGTKCGRKLSPLGALQRMESMVFAINEVNAKKLVHPNVTLGFTILDDCSNKITAHSKAMSMLEKINSCGRDKQAKVVAVIGAEYSTNTIKVATVLSLFKVPQLSFLSTHRVLDNMNRFSYFFRTVPSDAMQARAIVDILQQFQWSYVSIVYQDNHYGDSIYQEVKERMSRLGYCFSAEHRIRQEFDEIDYAHVAKELSKDLRVQVVVVVLSFSVAKDMFAAFDKNWRNNFTWIATEHVGLHVNEFSEVKYVVSGMLTLSLQFAPVERFNEYFKYLTGNNCSRNPWFKKFFRRAFNCSSKLNKPPCNYDIAIKNSTIYEPESTVSLSMDAVYVFAHALKAVFDNCSHTTSLPECVDGKRLRDAMTEVNFRGEHVHISFNENGSVLGSYEIKNVYFQDGHLVINTVGVWNSSTENFTYFHSDNITWNRELNHTDHRDHDQRKAPLSRCGEPCPVGFQQLITRKCCWNCSQCKDNERTVIINGIQICSVCPKTDNFTWPDKSTRTKCLPILSTFTSLSQKISVAIFVLNMLVLLSAVTISTLYIINRENRLIKASSREISQMMLGGHIIVCLLAMTYFMMPLELTCALFQIWFPLSLSITYGPLLVKTNRIYRIFMTKITIIKPRFTSPKSQIVMVIVIIAFQMLFSGIGLAIQPAKVVLMMPSIHTKYVEIVCERNVKGIVVSLTYPICLAIGCTAHAYKVRNVQANFNEAKFIIISLYCIALLWIGVIPGYLTADTEIIKGRWFVVFMLLNMFVAQVFLLYPKLFAIYSLDKGTTSSSLYVVLNSKSCQSTRG